MATPKKPEQEPTASTSDAALTVEQAHTYMAEIHLHLDSVDLHIQQLREEIFSAPPGADTLPLPKVTRRRSQDEMSLALRRLLSPDPRPRDDESPQILEDAINEVFALRRLNMDLMQAMSTAYQNGVSAIRELTSR